MSLEEEIVEIDAPEVTNANEVPDIDVEAISNNDDETKEVLNILRDMHQDSIIEQSGQAHSIKRKREGNVAVYCLLISVTYTLLLINTILF